MLCHKKQKLCLEEKIKLIQDYLKGKIGLREAARKGGVSRDSITQWARNYEVDGVAAFLPHENRVYPPELKKKVVEDYLSGSISQNEICRKYHIRKQTQLKAWIKMYTIHGDFDSVKKTGGSYMKQGRETTYEECIQIVTDCIANGKNYSEMAEKYQVRYQQIRSWTLHFEQMGELGLENRRGCRKKDQAPRMELEQAQIEIEQLNHKLYLAEMENTLLKKLDKIERRDAFQK